MPVGCLLISVRDIEQLCFAEIVADQLQTRRQVAGETTWNRHSRQSGEVDGNGIDVREVHLDRISRFFAKIERCLLYTSDAADE